MSQNNTADVLLPKTSESGFEDVAWMRWWYRLSLPPQPPEGSPFKVQDSYRRARVVCILLLLMTVMMSFSVIAALITARVNNMVVSIVVLVVLIISILLNRAGMLIVEGILLVGLWTIGLMFSFLISPQLSISGVIQYDLLTVAMLLAIAFFPAWSVFVIALFNCVFVVWSMSYLKHAPLLQELIEAEGFQNVAVRPISLTVVTMIITYLWARSSHHALQRADRAEMIARLQYDLSERDRNISVQKVQLEHSVQKIVDALTAYSNGHTSSRVPLTQDNVLWNIAGPINNLLNRVQRMRHAEAEVDRMGVLLQQARHENAALRSALQKQQMGPDSRYSK